MGSHQDRQRLAVAVLLMLASILSVALMSLAVHAAASIAHWTVVTLGRMVIGATVALMVALLARAPLLSRPERWTLVRLGTAGVGVPLTFYALTHMAPADAVTIIATGPLFSLVVEAALRRRAPPWRSVAAIGAAMVGIVMMHRPDVPVVGTALIAAFITAFCRGVAIVAAGRTSYTRPSVQVLYASAVAALTTVLFTLGSPDLRLDDAVSHTAFLPLILAIGLLGTIGNWTVTRALGMGPTHQLAPLMYVGPPLTAVLEWAILGRGFGPSYIAGMALIVGGCLWATMSRDDGLMVVELPAPANLVDATDGDIARWIAEIEGRALVEVAWVQLPTDGASAAVARATFGARGLNRTRRGNGLLFAPGGTTIVVVGGPFLEARLLPSALRRAVDGATTRQAWLEAMGRYLAAQVPAGDEARANEVDDVVELLP